MAIILFFFSKVTPTSGKGTEIKTKLFVKQVQF